MGGFRYKLHDADGNDTGEIELGVLVRPGDEINVRPGESLRVLEVVAVMETDSKYVGLLMVEAVVT